MPPAHHVVLLGDSMFDNAANTRGEPPVTGGAVPGSRHTVTVGFKQPVPRMFGPTMDLGTASLTFRYRDSFAVARGLEAYERLLHDAMLGDHTLFASAEGIERLWEVASPLLARPPRPRPYPRGSWGPQGVEELVAPHRWHLPYVDPGRAAP